MNNDKRSTMQYSPVAPFRNALGLPSRSRTSLQMKAKLSVWEGEGGAVQDPVAVAPAPTKGRRGKS